MTSPPRSWLATAPDGTLDGLLSLRPELASGLAMFHGFSKMVVVLGLEPEQMDTLVLPTPDVPR